MGILQLPTPLAAQSGLLPSTRKMVTTDSLATVTTAGYLNAISLEGYSLSNGAIIEMFYSYNQQTGAGTYGIFTVSVASGTGQITLTQWIDAGNVLLPVVSGDIPIFNGTTGQIKDSGVAFSNATDTVSPLFHNAAVAGHFVTVSNANKTIQDSGAAPSASSQAFVAMSPGSLTSGNFPRLNDANGTLNAGKAPSDATKTFVVMSPGAVTSGNLPQFGDVNGTLADSGIVPANVMLLSATNTMSGTGRIISVKANGTEAANAVTASGMAGAITTSALTTDGGSSYAITWTNTYISATSSVMLTIAGGTNTTPNITLKCVPGSGNAAITIYNTATGITLNGTIILNYLVM